MKYLKMLGLAVLMGAALATLFGTGTASATVLYSNGSALPKGTLIEVTGTNGVFKAGFMTIECSHSELDLKTSTQGSATQPVEGSVNTLKFSGCNATVTVIKTGKLVFHYTSGSNGTITSEGTEITINNHSFSCTYGTPVATDLGAVAGGTPARWNANASLTKISGGFLCATPASWTASYTFTTPSPLEVKES